MTTMMWGGLSPPPGPPHPSYGRRPWSDPLRGTGIGDDRLAEVSWPWGTLRTPVVQSYVWGVCLLGNVVFFWLHCTMFLLMLWEQYPVHLLLPVLYFLNKYHLIFEVSACTVLLFGCCVGNFKCQFSNGHCTLRGSCPQASWLFDF